MAYAMFSFYWAGNKKTGIEKEVLIFAFKSIIWYNIHMYSTLHGKVQKSIN